MPTPGSSNYDSYIGVVADTAFNTDRGFYENPFEVTISCDTEDVNIIYTTDGSEPTWPLIGSGKKYTEPVLIAETTVLRARGFKAGFKSTNTDTHTYIFINDVITQSSDGLSPGPAWPAPHTGSNQHIDYGMDLDVVNDSRYSTLIDDALLAIPTLSIVTDLANLFDADTGIYMNALEEGIEWERPTSLELIYPVGKDGFQIDAGLRIRGGWSRHNDCPKHAFRLFFRSKYGNAKLDFLLFDDEGTNQFDKIDLRTAQNYSWSYTGDNRNTFLRDVFSRDLQCQMGQPYTRSRFYHLYINGQYWGLYQTEERPEAHYAASYFGGDDSDYDVVKADGGPTGTKKAVATDGNIDAYVQLWDLANKLDDASETLKTAFYQQMQGNNPDGSFNPDFDVLLDSDNVIDYMLCTYYVGDKDGPISNFFGNDELHNFFCIYNRNNPDGFKFFRHDAEHSLGTGLDDRTGPYTVKNEKVNADYFNPQTLHQWLVEQPDYRMQFADRVYKHFFNDGPITQTNASDSVTNRQNQIELAIIAESTRWGDAKHHPPRTKDDDWLSAVDGVKNFFSGRVSTVLNQFKSKGWYPDFDPPVFYIEGNQQHGGAISKFDELTMNASGGTIYYTLDGTDPRRPGISYNITLVPENASKKVLIPTQYDPGDSTWRTDPYFDDSGWGDYDFISGKYGSIGYDEYSNYLPYITYDVENQMKNINTSCYIRIPFNINAEDLVKLNLMTLRLRYDDGIVAYLNGIEIARSNFLGLPSWDSKADQIHSDSLAVDFQDFDADDYLTNLQGGDNVLAIHGLNVGLSSSDFLISTEIIAGQVFPVGVSDTAIEYDGAAEMTESTKVKARVFYDDEWSALSEAVYAIGPVLDNLRITEIMYNPKYTGDPNDSDAEFIELKNIGDESINLNLVSFTKGINFTFPNTEIEPNEFILVVKDLNAFSSQGHDVPVGVEILYPYEGRLDNDGERIRLEDAIGRTILDFKYEDNWRPVTDGQGYSLTIVNSYTEPNNFSEKGSWAASTLQNGSPGSDDNGPKPGDIVINELLAHSDTLDDWIELYNSSGGTIDIGGWFLSDDNDDLRKYEIAVGTIIDVNEYIVFYEDANFGSLSTDPGSNVSFALSENGETVYLS
ncbi:MAG: lamin tail domain-containing protein, partial [Planctomycetota bacterium]